MLLKRVTIIGFKSFASKTVLDLEPGMTAVVGPNGSGKSNIADAIRWALGEQSKGRLRLGDREEVVFAGTERRARASFAEVVLLFDNEDGTFGVDLTEIEISRRLYRSGETEYRLAGRPVKLGDLQQLLAEAGFGVGSYAVIGQGTIDSLLMSSPAERKLLFDEAAGIRGAELGREAAQRKLAATGANLVRLRDIVAELAPRAASLERATEAAAEQARLEKRVNDLRATILATAEAEISDALYDVRSGITAAEHRQQTLADELATLARQQREQQAAAQAQAEGMKARQAELVQLEQRRDQAAAQLSMHQAHLVATEQAAGRQSDVDQQTAVLAKAEAALSDEQAELASDLAAIESQGRRAATAIATAATTVAEAQRELIEVRQQLSDGTRQQYVGHALALVKTMARQLDVPDLDTESLRLLIHKTGRLLSHASRTGEAELATRLKAAQAKLEAAMAKRETASEHQSNVTLSRRSLEIEQTRQLEAASRLEADQTALAAARAQLDAASAALPAARAAVTTSERALADLTRQLETLRSAAAAPIDTSLVARLAVSLERTKNELADTERRLAALHAAEADLVVRQQRYAERAQSWSVEPSKPDTRQTLAELDQALIRLEGELAARAQLGIELQQEYAEVTTRQHDLTAQIADLEAASADLTAMVGRLSLVVQERFKANFEKLGHEFSRQAHRLFGGGAASLELSEDDAGQYGITIKVSPKGKRLSSLAALSGGERALAGVALLAAILVVNPSPFVVLDEIDAALDDANSGRLADIMGELAVHSQLIVITHNRQTMKAARVLFGVTMDQQHVSSLLSLHLEQATQMAAR